MPGASPFREVLHDIGKATCHDAGSARCTIPVATSGPNGPCLGWYHGTRTADGFGCATLERHIFCMRDWGLNDLSLDAGEPRNYVGSLVTWFLGLDPVAEPPPQSFNCASEDLCATTALTEARVRYRLTRHDQRRSRPRDGAGTDARLRPEPAVRRRLRPRDQLRAARTARSRTVVAGGGGQPRASRRSVVRRTGPFRIFVNDVEQRCGNGVAEPGEECDGNDLHGNSCEDIGLGVGDLACGRSCRYDRSDCSPPGCKGGRGEPNCECVEVSDSPFCDYRRRRLLPRRAGELRRRGLGHRSHVSRFVRGAVGLRVQEVRRAAGPRLPALS